MLVIGHTGAVHPSAVPKMLIKAIGSWDRLWGSVQCQKVGRSNPNPKFYLKTACVILLREDRNAVSWKLLRRPNCWSLAKLTDNSASTLSSLQGRLFISCIHVLHSYIQFSFDLYSREEIWDLSFLIADSNFYKILNLVIMKQCSNLQCVVYKLLTYDHGTKQILTFLSPDLVSSHWGYYLDLQWYREIYAMEHREF